MAEKKVIKMIGASEEKIHKEVLQIQKDNPDICITVVQYPCEIHLSIEVNKNEESLKKECKAIFKSLKEQFKEYIFTTDEKEELEDVLVKALTKKNLTITTAESCTGGLLAGRIVNASGASNVLNQGFITYSNKAKKKQIEVRKDTLKKYGAVSKQTAKEMAKGAALVADADVALSVTGIAGPEGGTPEKPVGLVYIGCYFNGKTVVEEHRFKGTRRMIREASVASALMLLRDCLQ